MDLPRPRNYKELMIYRRCQEFKDCAGGMADDLFEEVYRFLLESAAHKVAAKNGELLFENDGEAVHSCPFTIARTYTKLEITAAELRMAVRQAQHYSSDSGGSSGNNNNNNNNNNNA